jgi:hypothetical protein
MPGDFSRRTFNPYRDIVGVYEQQGRVRLGADLNELVDALDARLRETSFDTLGPAVVPTTTPDGFLIAIAGGALTIGPGRAYVDGILVDNHGRSRDGLQSPAFDPQIEEQRGTAAIPLDKQPYVPVAPSPFAPAAPGDGTYLAYLDVWHRERTWVEEPALLDPALYGIDTTTRRQTVWQVKLHDLEGAAANCSTPADEIPGWDAVTRPSATRLTTNAVGVPASDDPCVIPPSGGFRGVENRLYRVEVHDGGALGTATFKWSRDNASLASAILAVNGAELQVVRPGRDAQLRFATGDWVELLDDDRELVGQPGEMAKVQSVDEVRSIVVLTAPPATALGERPRIRRWDQRPPGATGLLTATAAPGVLEDGVEITFSLDPAIAGGTLRAGEYWVFAARVADGSVEQLAAAPPVGPHHHIARLAIVDTVAGVVDDCRVKWPPPSAGDGCECDACVTAESHNSGAFTIQDAVNTVTPDGGTVCIGTGVFVLGGQVVVNHTGSVRIRGKGWRTIVLTPGDDPAFAVLDSLGITFEDLAVLGADEGKAPATLAEIGGRMAIGVANSAAVTVQRCVLITKPARSDRTPTLGVLGIMAALTVRDCVIVGDVAIGNVLRETDTGIKRRAALKPEAFAASAPAAYGLNAGVSRSVRDRWLDGRVLVAGWRISGNLLGGNTAGVLLMGPVITAIANRIQGNDVVANKVAGIAVGSLSLLGVLEIGGNVVASSGYGIVSNVNKARITDNVVRAHPAGALAAIGRLMTTSSASVAMFPLHPCGPHLEVPPETVIIINPIPSPPPLGFWLRIGIAVLDPLGLGARLDHVRIEGNDVVGVDGLGIATLTPVRRLLVRDNRVADVAAGGIVAVTPRADSAVVAENTVERLRGGEFGRDVNAIATAGIGVQGALRADVRDNLVESLATSRGQALGIVLDAVGAGRVTGNRVAEIGDAAGLAVGVLAQAPFDDAEVRDNEVLGGSSDPSEQWIAVVINGLKPGKGANVIKPFGLSARIVLPSTALFSSFRVPFTAGRDTASVRGNTVSGGGREPAVRARVSGAAVLSDNRCRHKGERGIAAFALSALSAAISANHLEVESKRVAIDADVAASSAAVVGNVTNGGIEVDGTTLTGAWAGVNVFVP